jgi:pimeloyl-ACP methyl ester carboxylesterase
MAGGLGVFLTALNQDRDVIIFDYRGIGYSDPSLTCPESIGVQDLSWVPECRARFEALGVDVTDYTTRDNAADAADIIRALGYDSYNVWGGSYGSSVAMTLLRDHPEHVRAAIVTALQPPQGDLQSMTVPYVLRTLDEVSALCQADAACAAAFPQDLTAQVLEVIERLNASPIPVDANGVQGELKGIQVLAVLSEMLKDETNFPIVPSFIATLAAGNYDAVVPYVNVLEPPADPLNPYGAWLSMRCTDSILVPSSDMIEEALQGLSPSVRGSFMDVHQGQRALCEAWGARVPTAADRLPAEADTPVLIISGALDPFSSQEWLASALETLPNGYGYMLPYHAHFVIHNPCASRLLIGFIDDPQQKPDANCMANIPSPAFQVP